MTVLPARYGYAAALQLLDSSRYSVESVVVNAAALSMLAEKLSRSLPVSAARRTLPAFPHSRWEPGSHPLPLMAKRLPKGHSALAAMHTESRHSPCLSQTRPGLGSEFLYQGSHTPHSELQTRLQVAEVSRGSPENKYNTGC